MDVSEKLAVYSLTLPNGCRVWTRAKDKDGYGLVKAGRVMRRAHRVSYELHVGPLTPGLVIDHLCRTPLCINPLHLEQVTNQENVRRGVQSRNGDSCAKGHRVSYVTAEGHRKCRVCQRDYVRAWRARRKAEAAA